MSQVSTPKISIFIMKSTLFVSLFVGGNRRKTTWQLVIWWLKTYYIHPPKRLMAETYTQCWCFEQMNFLLIGVYLIGSEASGVSVFRHRVVVPKLSFWWPPGTIWKSWAVQPLGFLIAIGQDSRCWRGLVVNFPSLPRTWKWWLFPLEIEKCNKNTW